MPLASTGRPAYARAEALTPAEFVGLAEALRGARRCVREGQPRSRRRRSPRWQARRRHRAPPDRPADTIAIEPAEALVSRASTGTRSSASPSSARRACRAEPGRVRIEKRIPVAAGLGGGSSDAATALRSGTSCSRAAPSEELHRVAARLGADVPFFLTAAAGRDGRRDSARAARAAERLFSGPRLPDRRGEGSTAYVYRAFDARRGRRLRGGEPPPARRARRRPTPPISPSTAQRPRLVAAETLLGPRSVQSRCHRRRSPLYGLFEHPAASGPPRSLGRRRVVCLRPLRRATDLSRLPGSGAWPSGKATGFGPVIPGSNPGAPATRHP